MVEFCKAYNTNPELSEFCEEIVDTHYSNLSKKLDDLKLQKMHVRHEVKQVFVDNIEMFLNKQELSVKIDAELERTSHLGVTLRSTLKRAAESISALKETTHNKSDKQHYTKTLRIVYNNISQHSNLFELDTLVRPSLSFGLFDELLKVFNFLEQIISLYGDKCKNVTKLFQKRLEILSQKVIGYLKSSGVQTKLRNAFPLIEKVVQQGSISQSELVNDLYSTVYSYQSKKQIQKFRSDKARMNTPQILLPVVYEKTFNRLIINLGRILQNCKQTEEFNQIYPKLFDAIRSVGDNCEFVITKKYKDSVPHLLHAVSAPSGSLSIFSDGRPLLIKPDSWVQQVLYEAERLIVIQVRLLFVTRALRILAKAKLFKNKDDTERDVTMILKYYNEFVNKYDFIAALSNNCQSLINAFQSLQTVPQDKDPADYWSETIVNRVCDLYMKELKGLLARSNVIRNPEPVLGKFQNMINVVKLYLYKSMKGHYVKDASQ